MTKVDQFESTFKSAAKPFFEYESPVMKHVVVVTDLTGDDAEAFCAGAKAFLQVLDERNDDPVVWTILDRNAFASVQGMLALIREHAPDLICTYRSLHSDAWRYTSTVGRYLDVLTQETETPVLVVPSPHLSAAATSTEAQDAAPTPDLANALRFCDGGTCTVMAMTDHLTGDHHLVSVAAYLTRPTGRLILTHVEDDVVFNRYMEAISKIPSIDTDQAREAIRAQLLKDPHDYVGSCAAVLRDAALGTSVEELIAMGHHLKAYERMVEEHQADLLVLNTKDDDQLAMHGRAYPLAVQLRHMPLLLL